MHLLVVKNCPRALEYLLNQTITTAVTPSSSPASSTEATEQGAAPDIYQAFSKRAIPGANTGTAAAAMFGGIASVAVAASKRQTSMKDEDDEEKEKDGLKTNGRTIKWALAKAAYQKRGEKVGDERTEEYKEKQSLGSGSSKEKDEQSRQWYQEAVDVNLASAQGETPLAIARALGHVACAVRMGAHSYSSLCMRFRCFALFQFFFVFLFFFPTFPRKFCLSQPPFMSTTFRSLVVLLDPSLCPQSHSFPNPFFHPTGGPNSKRR